MTTSTCKICGAVVYGCRVQARGMVAVDADPIRVVVRFGDAHVLVDARLPHVHTPTRAETEMT
jgi:hypothetical protein